MKSTSMLTLALPLTIQSRVTFTTTLSKSSTPTMAAAPWWIEHLHRSETPVYTQKSYVINSAWRNVMTSHYLAATWPTQSSRTTRSSSPALDSWLTPEALQESAPPSSPKSRHQSPLPNTSPRHLNLDPLALDQKPRLAFPQSPLAKALWTGPLPLSYRTRMGSLRTPFLPQTTMGPGTRSHFVATAKSGGTTRPRAQTRRVTFAPPMTTQPLRAHALTSVARTTTAGSCSATPTMDSPAQLKST
jgi:hypothetical protein